jgi:hypothetical protein
VAAIRAKGWHAEQIAGTFDALRLALEARRPAVLLIEDRPSRYHFVVAVGLTERDVVVHDPTWGPSRRIARTAFDRVWRAARSWMLVITPGASPSAPPAPAPSPIAPPASACDRLLDDALDDIERRGLNAADAALAPVRQQCPTFAGPLRELSGVRLAQARYSEARSLAEEALRLDPADRYARDVLGSSLFLSDDAYGALREWNTLGKPQLDRVDITGLTRTRYSFIAALTGLEPNTLLTAHDFALAARRIEQLPDRAASAVQLRPDADGFATVAAAIQETARRPSGPIEWSAAAAQALINREVVANVAGWTGQGEMWGGSWRWWERRPRIAASFTAPSAAPTVGIWRVEGAWEKQTYMIAGRPVEEERRTALASFEAWATPAFRYEARAGIDVWGDASRWLATGVTAEQRWFRDRLSTAIAVDRWSGFDAATGFSAAAVLVSFQSSLAPRGVVLDATARADAAGEQAPLALWSGAGDGRARPGLLRAHRMLAGGVIDTPVFGRRSASTSIELQRWFPSALAALGFAGFVDAAVAGARPAGASGDPYLIDAGFGLRAKIPGRPGTFRLDFASGLHDNARRLTASFDLR